MRERAVGMEPVIAAQFCGGRLCVGEQRGKDLTQGRIAGTLAELPGLSGALAERGGLWLVRGGASRGQHRMSNRGNGLWSVQALGGPARGM